MTTIRDTFDAKDYVTIRPQPLCASEVRITVRQGDNHSIGVLDRGEFLAAVAAELDVVIIPRADLPPVDTSDGVHVSDASVGRLGWKAAYLSSTERERVRSYALAYLAIAVHLEAEPQVDEAQVAALVDLMDVSDDNGVPKVYADTARRLVQAGVRAPEAGR